MVKSTLGRHDFEQAYALLDEPVLDYDCGELCGKRCCQEYEPGVGMYLLPGEESMFSGEERWLKWKFRWAQNHGFPPEWKGIVAFVMCRGTCPRWRRPIQCRTFPFMPYISQSGQLEMKLDSLSGSLICPIVRSQGNLHLRPEFAGNALKAWSLLIRDPLIRTYVELQSRKRDEDENAPWRRLLHSKANS